MSKRVKAYITLGCNLRTDTIKSPKTKPLKPGAFSLKGIKATWALLERTNSVGYLGSATSSPSTRMLTAVIHS